MSSIPLPCMRTVAWSVACIGLCVHGLHGFRVRSDAPHDSAYPWEDLGADELSGYLHEQKDSWNNASGQWSVGWEPHGVSGDIPGNEMFELLVGVLVQTSTKGQTMMKDGTPLEVKTAVKCALSGTLAVNHDFKPNETAQVLRRGVEIGMVDPEKVGKWLGEEDHRDVREAYFNAWAESFLASFKDIPDITAHQCGELIVDGMQSLFGHALKLKGLETGAIDKFIELFAKELLAIVPVKTRFQQVRADSIPSGAENIETALYLLAFRTLMLTTEFTNPSAPRTWTSNMLVSECSGARSIFGFDPSVCEGVFDQITKRYGTASSQNNVAVEVDTVEEIGEKFYDDLKANVD